jgi:hypothetical protein
MDLFRKKKKPEPLSPKILLGEMDRSDIGAGTSGDLFPPTSPDHMAEALTSAAAVILPTKAEEKRSMDKTTPTFARARAVPPRQ